MWHLTKLAVRSRIVTILLALVISAVSVWAFLGLKVELIPDISFPYTTIVTIYPQATPDQVLDEVTVPIEKYISDKWSDKELKHITSTSSSGMSVIMAEFEYGMDMDAITTTINQDIGSLGLPDIVAELPGMMEGLQSNPQIIPINMNVMPIMTLSLSGDMSPEQLKQVALTQIVPQLSSIDGVLRVDTEGGEKDEIVISPNPDAMNQYGISLARIYTMLGDDYTSLQGISSAPMGEDGAVLADIATISKSPPPLTAITRVNGQPSVALQVTKTDSANTVDVSDAVNERLEDISLPDGVVLTTILDQSDFIHSSINQLWEKAIIGGVMAVIVVLIFLMAVRASLITAISIPLSLFIGFLCMRLTGVTLNILTLSAMIIAVGRLIDDSIVMVEVIFRRVRRGEGFKEAAISGAKEVAGPITTATLATVAIFIPLMFVGGLIGQMFIPFALTVSFAMLASLLVALTLVPALSRLLGKVKGEATPVSKDNWYQKIYARALSWTLRHTVAVVVIAFILFVGSLGLLTFTGTSFMSGAMGEATITVSISLPPSADIDATSAATAEIEDVLARNDTIRSYYSTIGTSSTSLTGIMSAAQGGGGANTATITVYLKEDADLTEQTDIINRDVQGILSNGVVTVSGEDSGAGMGAGFSTTSMSLSVQGDNQEDISRVASQLMESLQSVEGLADLQNDLTVVLPKLDIVVDPEKVAASGLSAEQLPLLQQEFAFLMSGGTLPGKSVTLDGEAYPVYVKGVASNLSGVEQAGDLKIGYPQSVSLANVADISIMELPSHIAHTDTMLSATVSAVITEKNVGAVNSAIQQKIDQLPDHPGVEVVTAGIAEEMNDTFTSMGIAILIAIVLVFAIVILMMRSFINPLLIMISLPLAVIGSIPALLISGQTLGISALMGLLMLVGIVLTNAIVLVEMVEANRKSGMSVAEALMSGGKTRLRPILMTALTTIFAMLPMVILSGSETLLSSELAIVVIGGMVSSTFLTLFVIPSVYSLVHRRKEKKVKAV